MLGPSSGLPASRDMVKRYRRRQKKILEAWERFGHPNTVVKITEKDV